MLISGPCPDVQVIDESGRELHTIGKHLHQDFDRIGKSLVGELQKLLALVTAQAASLSTTVGVVACNQQPFML